MTQEAVLAIGKKKLRESNTCYAGECDKLGNGRTFFAKVC